jgi:membrane-associated protein
MPQPSSVMRISLTPPSSRCTWIALLPASRLFSSSSLRTEAGLSTTSPAAIWLISRSGRRVIVGMAGLYLGVKLRLSKARRTHMEFLTQFIDIVLHLDKHLALMVQQYGLWIYGILFFIIFAETGFVVTPFLPGDSLLFVAGALAALGEGGMEITTLIGVLSAAAILGNMVNYQIGRYLGPKVFHWENSRFFNRDALVKTHAFYEKHGGKTLVISRFLPLFRTFAPFVAGIGSMSYAKFTLFNLIGALGWVVSLCLAGYWLGNMPWVKTNLSLIIVGIIISSLIPLGIGYVKSKAA